MQIRTLLVDDSPETLEALALLYGSNQEIEVVGTVQTASEALTFLESTSIDLISVDIHLGADNGFHLCSEIHESYPDVFVAMCSLEDDDSYRHMAQQTGAQYYMGKPITQADIWGLVHHLRRRQGVDLEHSDSREDDVRDLDWVVRFLGTR
ncbi:response regulator transcription factor [Alicyclobacillus sp. ALC3]|uniref:response regulator transcription factor n=1 Tax=Alicyclobacillus sp. ALC3 TaxID=2796143 RepID=UPI002378C517|nr:response regulator [Alicyclobacillus sp. ALC3]WDL96517.1 response regulator transcription factor [Alicyclobacillus sp. ALC3]